MIVDEESDHNNFSITTNYGKYVSTHIKIKGIFSMYNSNLMSKISNLMKENIDHFLFDLTECTGISASGIGFLVLLVPKVESCNKKIMIITGNDEMTGTLISLKLNELIITYKDYVGLISGDSI